MGIEGREPRTEWKAAVMRAEGCAEDTSAEATDGPPPNGEGCRLHVRKLQGRAMDRGKM